MSMTRRDLLAGIALTPLVAPLQSALGASTFANPATGLLNVFLQGLFFLEVKQDADGPWLEITAPEMRTNHDLLAGVPGNLQDINHQIVNWRNVAGLQHGTPKGSGTIPSDVPNTMYQFTRSATGVGDIVGSNQGKILLPWPNNFFTIRQAARPGLKTRLPNKPPDSQVHNDIEKLSSKTIGVVTLLQYAFSPNLPPIPEWPMPSINIHFYFQPKTPQQIKDVNEDLKNASPVFRNDSFDLQIDENASATAPIGAAPYPTIGVSSQDELALNERVQIIPSRRCVPVQDCLGQLQSCLEELETDLSLAEQTGPNKETSPLDRQHGRISKDREKARRSLSFMMASPANCPMFFVG